MEVLEIDKNESDYKILKINLKENPGFIMPDNLGHYRTWYDFFQGSMGGEQTTIILIELVAPPGIKHSLPITLYYIV
ncbi:MAG: hypothetical protein Q8N38_06805 [Bacteroidales bacterium]|nr:hypothetical protein [Bacteroidales bacterium]